MKRAVYIILLVCLLLSACGKAPAEPIDAGEPSATESPAEPTTTPAEPTPSPAEPTHSPAEREQRKLEESEIWFQENYTHWGKFYAQKEDYDSFLALPQE